MRTHSAIFFLCELLTLLDPPKFDFSRSVLSVCTARGMGKAWPFPCHFFHFQWWYWHQTERTLRM